MNKESIEACLAGKRNRSGQACLIPTEIYYYEITDSTNARAWEETRQSTGNGALFVADRQNNGRGRRGRSWVSPSGKNIYFSLVLRPKLKVEQVSMVTLVMALSVARAIERYTGAKPGIKWPNDILLQGKKICGILTELKLTGNQMDFLVVGVGINVKAQDFPRELAEKAGDLESLCGRSIFRSELLAEVLHCFEQDYACFLEAGDMSGLREAYQERLVNKDRQVQVLDPQGTYEGIARGIAATGQLLVERLDGTLEQVYAGEVSVRGLQGYI